MTIELSNEEIEQIMGLRKVMQRVLNTEPGTHPEIPELIHSVLKAMLTTLIYTLNLAEGLNMEINQHKLDQEIGETALLKIFTDLGIVSPELYQKAVVQATEQLGGIDVGQA